MRATLSGLWREHRLLLTGFVLATVIAALLVLRLTMQVAYFSTHRDTELAGWMPVGYISHSYNVDAALLAEAIGLPPDAPKHTSLAAVAEMQGRPLEAVEQDILDAVQAARAAQ